MQVFSKKWFMIHQKKLLAAVNTDLGKWFFRIGNDVPDGKPIVQILPNCYTWLEGFTKDGQAILTTDFRTHDKFAKRLYYGLRPVWSAMHFLDGLFIDKWFPELSFGFFTLTAYPAAGANSPCDGYVNRVVVSEAFTTIRNSVGNGVSVTENGLNMVCLASSSTTNQYGNLTRSIFMFDTSPLPNNIAISAVTLSIASYSLSGNTKANWLGLSAAQAALAVVNAAPASTSNLLASDYGNVGTTRYSSDFPYASWSGVDGTYNDITITDLSSIDKNGISKFGTRLAVDVDSGTPPWGDSLSTQLNCYYADNGSNEPKLVVTYRFVGADFFELF